MTGVESRVESVGFFQLPVVVFSMWVVGSSWLFSVAIASWIPASARSYALARALWAPESVRFVLA